MNPTFRSPGLVRLLLRALLRPLFRVQVTGDPGVFTNDRTLIVGQLIVHRFSFPFLEGVPEP